MSKSDERKAVKSLVSTLGISAAHARALVRKHGSYANAVRAYKDSLALVDDTDSGREGRHLMIPKTEVKEYANPQPVDVPERLADKWKREDESGIYEPDIDSKIGRRAKVALAVVIGGLITSLGVLALLTL